MSRLSLRWVRTFLKAPPSNFIFIVSIAMIAMAEVLHASSEDFLTRGRRPFGIGVFAGDVSGISAENYISDSHALDFGIGWNTSGKENWFNFHMDFHEIRHSFVVIARRFPLHLYYGAGPTVRVGDKTKLGIRLPGGVKFAIPSTYFATFTEVVPKLNLVPDTEFDLEVAVGIRYYF